MGLQRYRSDYTIKLVGGQTAYYCNWVGGPTLTKIEECQTPFGPRMVYVTGEPDTFFSLPAACRWHGRNVRGFIMRKEDTWEFTPLKSSWVWPRVTE